MTGHDEQSIAFNMRALVAAIASVSVVGIAIGLGIPLLSIVMESQGYSNTMIGANTAVAGIASMITAPFATRLAQKFGLTRVLLVAIIMGGISFLGFAFSDNLFAWFVLRAILHIALALIFIYSEVWINSSAPAEKRGFVFGIYATVLSLGFACGPAILATIGSDGVLPFAVGSGIILAAFIPAIWAIHEGPALDDEASAPFSRFLIAVPVATAAVLVFGITETGVMALFPIYGLKIGFSETNTALLLAMFGLGNVFLQIPLGVLSDRLSDRRQLLWACGTISLCAIGILPFVSQNWGLVAVCLFFLGGMSAGLYTIGLAHLGSKMKGSDLAAANSAFVFCYALGSLIGPPILGRSMDQMGSQGFAIGLGVFFCAYILFVSQRLLAR